MPLPYCLHSFQTRFVFFPVLLFAMAVLCFTACSHSQKTGEDLGEIDDIINRANNIADSLNVAASLQYAATLHWLADS